MIRHIHINGLKSNQDTHLLEAFVNRGGGNEFWGVTVDGSIAGLDAAAVRRLQGRVWVKSGADKRHVTAHEEMQRMFQRGGLLQADQVPVRNASVADIDERAFGRYFERRYGHHSAVCVHRSGGDHQPRPFA